MLLRVPLLGVRRLGHAVSLLKFLRPLKTQVRLRRLPGVDLNVDPGIAVNVGPPALERVARPYLAGFRIDEYDAGLLARIVVERQAQYVRMLQLSSAVLE